MKRSLQSNVKRSLLLTILVLVFGCSLLIYFVSGIISTTTEDGPMSDERKSLNMEIRLKEMQLKIDRSDEQLRQLTENYNRDLQTQKEALLKERGKLLQLMENFRDQQRLSDKINTESGNNPDALPKLGGGDKEPDNLRIVKNIRGYNGPDELNNKRADAVRKMFVHAFSGYEKYCMGKGELKPRTNKCDSWLADDMGLTIIDSLDTMLIMGLDDMYMRGKKYIEKYLDWEKQISRVSFFEITIRCLGGLLSAHHLTGDKFLLHSAITLANKLLPAFDGTKSGFPYAWINLNDPQDKRYSSWTGGEALLAEYGSVQMEFAYLAHLTKNPAYFDKPMNVYKLLIENRPPNNVYPFFFHPDKTDHTGYNGGAGIGAWGDSFYEYVLKYWVMTGKKDDVIRDWYLDVSKAVISYFSHTIDEETVYLAEKDRPGRTDHLSCFAGGMFSLGAQTIKNYNIEKEHARVAAGVGKFCHDMYIWNKVGLPCDNYQLGPVNGSYQILNCADSTEYIMRPEAVETWFYLYRATGDKKYQEWGWAFYESIEKYTKTESGYGGLSRVNSDDPNIVDKQQSFFLAETLKYLFLLFSPVDVVPLDQFVFNTEAHVFPIINNFEFKMSTSLKKSATNQ